SIVGLLPLPTSLHRLVLATREPGNVTGQTTRLRGRQARRRSRSRSSSVVRCARSTREAGRRPRVRARLATGLSISNLGAISQGYGVAARDGSLFTTRSRLRVHVDAGARGRGAAARPARVERNGV